MRKSFPLLILVSVLAACGLKGPLFIPEPKPAAAPPAPAAASGTQADDKKSPDSK
jgi:predicted small lipoprotein YifL